MARLQVGANRFQRIERHDLIGRVIPDALGFNDDNPPQLWQFVAAFQNLVDLLLILAHDDLGFRMRQHISDFVRRTGGINPNCNTVDNVCAKLRQHPFDPVLGQNADVTACTQSQRA